MCIRDSKVTIPQSVLRTDSSLYTREPSVSINPFCHSEERSDVGIRNPLTVRRKTRWTLRRHSRRDRRLKTCHRHVFLTPRRIATPVCGLARNDRLFRQPELPLHEGAFYTVQYRRLSLSIVSSFAKINRHSASFTNSRPQTMFRLPLRHRSASRNSLGMLSDRRVTRYSSSYRVPMLLVFTLTSVWEVVY